MNEGIVDQMHFKKFGFGDSVIILHGLFGSITNWYTVANELANKHEIILIDLRNHGKSFHSNQFNYDVMADDLMRFIRHHELHNVSLIGHSMGGKVAMQFAFCNPDLVHKLVIVDITYKRFDGIHQDVIEALCALDTSKILSLKDANEKLKTSIPDDSLRLFLLKNLKSRNGDGYHWQINMEAIRNGNKGLSREVVGSPFPKPCLFMRGKRSGYIQDSDWFDILRYFPEAKLTTIPAAGHWVHIDAHERFVDAVASYLDE